MNPLSQYFDYNANAPLYPAAMKIMMEVMTEVGSPSSVHHFGRHKHKRLEEARCYIGEALEARPQDVIFTSGASEANNMALRGYETIGYRLFVSACEHPSVGAVSDKAEIIPVTAQGVVDLNALETMLKQATDQRIAVAIMAANNETGVVQPIQDVVALARKYGAVVHSDAVQTLGRIPCSYKDLGVDSLVISAHKIGGPVGAGALIMREEFKIPSLILGAKQEKNRRAGTENVMAIVGFAKALEIVLQEDWSNAQLLRDWFEGEITRYESEETIYGAKMERLPNTSCIRMPGVSKELQVMAFDLGGFSVSAGSACSSGKLNASTTLLAMGISPVESKEAIRISLQPSIQKDDLEQFVGLWKNIYKQKTHKGMRK